MRERRGVALLWSVVYLELPSFQSLPTCMWKCACFRTGIGSRRDFISSCFRNSAGEAYRSLYTYFSDLVARTRLPVLRKMSG